MRKPTPPTPSDARRTALALAAAAFALAAPAAYVAQRLYEIDATDGPINPLLVLRDKHTAFYWRAATATWWGGVAAIVTYALARRGARPARALRWAALPLIGLVILLSWWFP